MSNRFHNKFHRQNHHSDPTVGYPDSAFDPIASFEQPFKGEFYSQGDIITTQNLSAGINLNVTNNANIFGTSVRTPNIGTGEDNSVVVLNSSGYLKTDEINPGVWDTTMKFVSASDGALTVNRLTKATDSTGINESIVYDDGTNVGIRTAFPSTVLHISGSDGLVIPVGTTSERVNVQGAIRYNKQDQVFEGYDGSNWGSLGGVKDVNQDTYITAENFPGVNNDELKFFTFGTERMRILSGGNVGINTGNPNVELTVVGDISATGTIYAKSIVLSGRSLEDVVTTTTNVTADLSAGAIPAGGVVPAGTSLQEFVELLLLKTFYPTFTNPSASMSSNLASTVESGTTGITLTVNLNRGAITGKSVGGIWQPSTFQDFRSGAATNYVINGTNNGSTNSLTFPSVIIADGSNSFSSTTTYAQGPQPVDSKGVAYLTPLASGTVNASVSVTGARRGFYGVSNLANTSALIRSLGNSTNPGVSNGTSFTISIPSGATSVAFAYPSTLQNVTTVKYVEGLNAEVKNNFTQTTVAVEGLNSYTAINYKVYRYVPVEPFPAAATYTVTI